jgi:hypothetical protein
LAVIWSNSMPRPGMTVTLVSSGLVVLVAVRVRVTIFCPPISVGAWAWVLITTQLATAAGRTKEIT